MELIHTCYRMTDPDRSVAFHEALGFEERRRLPIRDESLVRGLNARNDEIRPGLGSTTVKASAIVLGRSRDFVETVHSSHEGAQNAGPPTWLDFMVVETRARRRAVMYHGYRVNMSETLRLTIRYEDPDEDGWIVARVIEVPGAISQGRTREEARENVIDALRLMLSPDDDDTSVAAGRSEQLDLILSG
jgi:predicted RNase H-like HicB family nuclease